MAPKFIHGGGSSSPSWRSRGNTSPLLRGVKECECVLYPKICAWHCCGTQGFKAMYDPILAYQFIYPVVGKSGQQLQMVLTHPPEKV